MAIRFPGTFAYRTLKRRIFPLLLIVVALHLFVQWTWTDRPNKEVRNKHCLNSSQKTQLKELVLFVSKALDHLNQSYWLDFDCLMGAMTMGEILPQFSHCDLGLLASDKVPYLQQNLRQYIHKHDKIGIQHEEPELKYGKTIIKYNNLEVNLYFYILDEDADTLNIGYENVDEAIYISSHYWHKLWRKRLPKRAFLPLGTVEFYGKKFPVPGDAWSVLGMVYEFIHQMTAPRCPR